MTGRKSARLTSIFTVLWAEIKRTCDYVQVCWDKKAKLEAETAAG